MKPLPYNKDTQRKKSTQQAKALKPMAICLMLFSGCTCSKQSPLKAYRYTPPPPPPPQETWTWTKLNCAVLGPDVVVVNPQNSNILYVGSSKDSGCVLKSADGGNSFTQIWNRPVFDLALDPGNTGVVYAAGLTNGIWRSRDGGNTWVQLTPLYGEFIRPDRFDSSYIYAGPWRSTDYGVSWSRSVPYLITPTEVSGLDQSRQNPNLLYAGWHASGGGRVYKSIDRGGSWTTVRGAVGEIYQVLVSPFNDQYVFADISRGTGDSLARTTDGGTSWTNFAIGPGISLAAGLAVDPRPGMGNILYAGGNITQTSEKKGVYRSTNGGETWEQIGLQGIPVWNLTVDPTAPTNMTILYAVSNSNGAPTDGLYRGELTKP